MPRADELCPFGFAPHSVRPTRCKRCFRDYSEHKKKDDSKVNPDRLSGSKSPSGEKSEAATTTTTTRTVTKVGSATGRTSPATTRSASPGSATGRASPGATSGRASPGSTPGSGRASPKTTPATTSTTTTTVVRRRRPQPEETLTVPTTNATDTQTSPNGRRRFRQRPGSWSGFENDKSPESDSVTPDPKPPLISPSSSYSSLKRTDKLPLFEDSSQVTSADVQFMLQVKKAHLSNQQQLGSEDGDQDEDMVSVAGTETTEATLIYHDSVEELQDQVASLSKQLAETNKPPVQVNEEVKKLKQKIFELETVNEELKDEKHVLQLENKELQEEVDKRPAPENIQKTILELQHKLQASESMCEELMEENDEYKREIQGLEDEMNEIQDNFSEDQASQYMDVKKELEQTAKNCRVIQFKLKKVERRCAQIESEKNAVEEQLRTLTKADNIDVDQIHRIQQLEAEVKASKEVTLKLTNEMDALHTKLRRTESEKEAALMNQKSGNKISPLTVNSDKGGRVSPVNDTTQLMRELYDTVEREKDIREQLKFSEEEAKSLRKRMSNLEDENEGLLIQLKKMATSTPKGRSLKKDSENESSEMSMSEIKVQMELLEQEAKVLRKKLSDSEIENDSLSKEIKYLECQLSEKKPLSETNHLASVIFPATNKTDVDLNYYEQRVKLLDIECNDLRRKLIDKERENEQLCNDLAVTSRRRGSKMVTPAMQRSKSLDSDSQQIDHKRQLQLIEQEVAILRQRTNDIEAENEKLLEENKRLQLKVGATENGSLTNKKPGPLSAKLKEKIKEMEAEATETKKRMAEIEEENNNLKRGKMIQPVKKGVDSAVDLKKQLEKMQTNLKTAEESSEKLKKHIEELKMEKETKLTEAEMEKRNLQKELSAVSTKLSQEIEKLNKAEDDMQAIKKQLTLNEKNSNRAEKKLEEQNLLAMQTLSRKLEKLERDLEEEKERFSAVKKRLDNGELVEFEQLRKVEQEKHKLQKESMENEKKVNELARKIQDMEQASKDSNKVHRNLKRELEDTHKELENERAKMKKVESKQSDAHIVLVKEREELRKQVSDLVSKEEAAEEKLKEEKARYKTKVESMEDEVGKVKSEWAEKVERKEGELKMSRDQVSSMRNQVAELQAQLLMAAKGSGGGEFEEKYRRLEQIYKREKDDWSDKEVNLESIIKTEVKRRERMEKDYEGELRDRDDDMHRFKDKIKKLENELKRMNELKGDLKGELEDRVKELEKGLSRERQEYEDLTSKYELLEEEYLVLKAQKVMEKEQVEANYNVLKQNFSEIEGELKALRETFNTRQDTWIKDKLDLQEKVKELTTKLSRANVSVWDVERARLKETIEEKQATIEQIKKEDRTLKDEVERLKRQVDDTKRMLEDYNRLKSFSKNIDRPQSPVNEKEIEDLKTKLQAEEKAHRSELSSMKMKSEQRMVILQDEIHALHLQNAKFRREKDTFKEMLEGAQKTLSELKSDSVIKERSSHVYAQLDDTKQKLEALRKEKEEILDKLDLAERNCSKAKTEYMTEKASWEIKMATLQTKINELEETTILQGGRSKIFGVKTKLELAWQKEREEQHRLLTESHKMARDLKQRLLDIESARDRERLESVRHLDQLRQTMEEQQLHMQTKTNEMRTELSELRDAHSKLSSTNERVRRQKDRLEWEKEEMHLISTETKQIHLQDKITISNLSEELRTLKSMVPKVLGEGWDSKKGPHQVDEDLKETFKTSLKKISASLEELRKLHGQKDEDKIKRNLSFRRAISEDEDESGQTRMSREDTNTLGTPLGRWRNPQRVTNYPLSPPSMFISPNKRFQQSLHRKAVSLDMESGGDEGSHGSNTSLDSAPVPSPRVRRRQRVVHAQSSIESDVSNTSLESLELGGGVSSSSEVSKVQSEGGRKREGFTEKLRRKLMKTKSIEATPTADHIRKAGFQVMKPGLGGGSASSVASETGSEVEGGRKDLRTRITKLFQKSGSRGGSVEKEVEGGRSQTLNRPLVVSPKTTEVRRAGTLSRFGSTGTLNK